MANITGGILVTGLAAPSSSSVLMADSSGSITWGSPAKNVLMKDEVTGEIYELVISDGKLEIRATSKQGIRQQKIENIIKEDE